ncbi:MAG: hypothetical protein A2008_08080 [Candidatus Wallbacteria bacterium GWC2_49_35]|uniref:Uncharacterized protein n=1 Tax=Candidatus Wallbacteria bacterium GWC2_49_35 TaxID=1817813 RepID=A0A1F7WML3_9BACT|nr:MAG: hypothetical protein A2008_08080 [Candidatus Wallbacteria bacterium GWC2_49_35]HBC76184.1 hypothetical protein [Candidatus Wallbacteria bacterium]
MLKWTDLKRTLTRHAVIPASLILLALLILAYLSFFYRLSGLGASLKNVFAAGKSSFFYNASIRLNKAQLKQPGGAAVTADDITLNFETVRNLLNIYTCDAVITLSGTDAAAAYASGDEFLKSLSAKLRESGLRVGRAKIRFEGPFTGDGFFNFSFDATFKMDGAVCEYDLSGAGPAPVSASAKMDFGGSSSEISLAAQAGGGFVFTSRALPLQLFKNRIKSKYFELNTAEIDLTFKTPESDLSNFTSFYDISGRAANFSFIYLPFKCLLKSDFTFKILDGRLIVEDAASAGGAGENKAAPRLSGYIDFKSRSLSVEFLSSQFDLSYFSAIFSKFKNFLSRYSPSGYAKIFIKIEGALDNPETYAELNLSNAMLQGDAGYKNINNISGKLNFINSKISFNDIAGSLMSSKVGINGVCDISQISGGGDISINFSEIPVTEVKEYMIFNENEIEKLISYASSGRLSVTLKLSRDGGFRGNGTFSKCKLSLPVKNEVIEISDAGGNFTLGEESIEFSESYGFIGNVPFFFTASFSKKSLKNYVFNVRVQNIDFSEIIAGKSSYEFLNFISRIQAQSKSKLELKISSDGSAKISSELKLKLSHPDISLYPLPFSLNIENVDGGINFDYDTQTGAFELDTFDFALRGASKILLLSFLYRSVPVSISGNLYGDIHLSQKKVITGNFSIAEGVVRYFDNKYVELFIKVADLNAYFTVQNTIINGICKLKLLAGDARLDFKSDFASFSLASVMSFNAENINLDDIHYQNPRLPKYIQGMLNVNFKSVYNAKDKQTDGLTGSAVMKNGRFMNLNRLDIVSKKDIVPNRIYDFSKFHCGFNLNKDKLKISSPVYEGADKQDFLTVLKNIDYSIDL